jgi:hypothetical protein
MAIAIYHDDGVISEQGLQNLVEFICGFKLLGIVSQNLLQHLWMANAYRGVSVDKEHTIELL